MGATVGAEVPVAVVVNVAEGIAGTVAGSDVLSAGIVTAIGRGVLVKKA